MSRFRFDSEIVPLVNDTLINIVNQINGIKDEMKFEYSLLENNTGFGIDEVLERMMDFAGSDLFSMNALETVKVLLDIGRLVEDAENRAAAVDYLIITPVNESLYTSVTGSSGGGSSSGGGRRDNDVQVDGFLVGGAAAGLQNIHENIKNTLYDKPYSEVYNLIPKMYRKEYFKYHLDKWIGQISESDYNSKFESDLRSVLFQCEGIGDDNGNFCYVYRNGNQTRYFKWYEDGVREFNPGYEITEENVGAAVRAVENRQISYYTHKPNGTRLANYEDGRTRIDYDTNNRFNQHSQVFTHGEDRGVECTSTALAQCNNINGGSYRIANDYNNSNGITQIGFYQVNNLQLKKICENNIKAGRSTCIYYNYGYTDQSTGPGGCGHCVTVVGTRNPDSNIIEDLIVVDPATGNEVFLSDACGFPTGHAKNLYIAYEGNPGYGNATQYSEIAGLM